MVKNENEMAMQELIEKAFRFETNIRYIVLTYPEAFGEYVITDEYLNTFDWKNPAKFIRLSELKLYVESLEEFREETAEIVDNFLRVKESYMKQWGLNIK